KLSNGWYNCSKMALGQSRYENAIFYIRKASSQGTNMNTVLTLIRVFQNAGHAQQAEAKSEWVRNQDADDAGGIAAQANILRLSDDAAALRLLESQLATSSDPATIHYEIGLLHYANDDFEAAVGQFETALANKPGMIEVHRSLNSLLWQQEDARFLSS